MLFDNLSPNQEEAVKTIDDDIEIIACAGAGKTGVEKLKEIVKGL